MTLLLSLPRTELLNVCQHTHLFFSCSHVPFSGVIGQIFIVRKYLRQASFIRKQDYLVLLLVLEAKSQKTQKGPTPDGGNVCKRKG